MMGQPVSHLTQSKFYSPAFNAAIFDGPIRIYFAQHQENLALQVYFRLQKRLEGIYRRAKEQLKQQGQTIFLMLYPTQDIFDHSFNPPDHNESLAVEYLGEDVVLGVKGPLEEQEYESVYRKLESILNHALPEPTVDQ